GRPVAIKVLRSDLARDAGFLGRFRREAQSAAGLNHPSIVAIYDSGEDVTTDARGTSMPLPYIVMEVVDGETLRERLTRETTVSPDEAARLTEGVLSALAYSHRMGIIHRDIKPANVMVTTKGAVKVMDFGIARAVSDSSSTMTQTQAVIGTAQYLSPEQAQGQPVDARSDLYSTGCLLFELLAGRAPFVGDSPVSVAYQHVGEQPHPPSTYVEGVPAAFDTVTLHALVKDRERRYQSAMEFRADVVAARTGRPLSPEAAGTAAAASASGAAPTALLAGPTGLDPFGVGVRGSALPDWTDDEGSPLDTGGMPAVGHHDDVQREDRERRRRGPAYVLLAVAAVAALLLVAVAGRALFQQNQGPDQASVPRVIGLTVDQARATLAAGKFIVVPADVANDTAPKGQVVGQAPNPNTMADVGSTVALEVSSGPGQTTVPDVAGLDQAEATTTMTAAGLTVSLIDLADDPARPRGQVIDTAPAYGAVVAKGSSVTLRVASGKVPVAAVVGKHFSVAQATL
ncbi:MAG: Stk1 family PASTA domain-containing Ser/Thr kinase, partial [Lapillicoccus sp.]